MNTKEMNIEYLNHLLNDEKSFSKSLIEKCKTIVSQLYLQPMISSNEKVSIQLQYELEDKSCLEFEIFENKILCIEILKGEYNQTIYPIIEDMDTHFMNRILVEFFSESTEFLEDNLKILEEFKTLKRDWDGEGAKSISWELIEFLKDIMKRIDIQPDIFPLQDGSISIEFGNVDNRYLEITFHSLERISIYKKDEFDDVRVLHNIKYEFDRVLRELKWWKGTERLIQYNINKLHTFLQFEENWDGEGAISFDKDFIEWFEHVLKGIDVYQPEIFPLKDGGIQIECEDGFSGSYLEIEIKPNKTMNIFEIDKDGHELENDQFIPFNLNIVNQKIYNFYKHF